MKKPLLFIMAMSTIVCMAQNVDENKVTFNFIQLPTNPIAKQYTSFDVVIERKYEQANNDSLLAYQAKLDEATMLYESEMLAWKEQTKVVERDYYTKMAAWQKTVNASGVAQMPTNPIYPVQPVMQEVVYPKLHSDISDDQVQNAISLAGYDRGSGGAVITVGILPVSDIGIQLSEKGEGSAKKYTYTANYKLPVELKVEDPTSGVVLQTIVMNSLRGYTIDTYASQYEFDLWWVDNKDKFWLTLEERARREALQEVNNFVNDKCGFPVKSRTSEVYTVKKYKEHQYNDLTNAYTIASQGYQMVSQKRDRTASKNKLNEAIKIWKQMLTESNMADNKARINDKVTALLYCNIAEAYIWMSEFDTAEQYINQALNAGVGKFKRAADDLNGLLTERKMRWNTNF